MAKQRKKTTIDSKLSGDPSREPTSAPAVFGARATLVLTVGFLIFLAVYLVMFYRAEYGRGVYRYQLLGYALVPDELFAGWCGDKFGEFGVLDRLPIFFVAMCILATAFLLGWLLLCALRTGRYLCRLETFVFAEALGLSGLSLATLIVGLLGGLRRPTWLGVLAVAVIAGSALVLWRRGATGVDKGKTADGDCSRNNAHRSPDRRAIWLRWRWLWLAVPFVAAILMGAALPPIDFDVKEYHLQVPKEWYQAGQITFLPHNIYGNMPLGAESLTMPAMVLMPGELDWWRGALAGKVVMAGFAPLTALLLFAAGCRFFSDQAGTVAALLYISTAWIATVSVNGLNEGVVAFYLFASAYAVKLWVDRRVEEGDEPWGLLALAGLLAGSALACKYTAMLYVVIPVGMVVLWYGRSRHIQVFAVYVLAVLLACGVWFGKNWAQTGNPTYPLLVGTFGGATRTTERDAQWRRAHEVPRDSEGRSYTPTQAWQSALQLLGRSRWHNPLLVPFAMLLVVYRDRFRQVLFWLAGLFAVITLWWLFTHRIDRFWVPALPLLALLAGAGATWSQAIAWRRVMWVILSLGLFANLLVVASPLIGDNRYFVRLDQLRDDPRLTQVSVAHRYLNERVKGGNRTLLVGDAAVFDLRVPIYYSTCFDACVFEQIFRGRSRDQRRARLAELRITHIYVNWAEIARYRQPGNYGFTDYVTRELIHDELVARQRLIRRVEVPGLEREQGELFEVNPAAE